MKLLGQKTNTRPDCNNVEIYLEVAALRDYWYELGDYHKNYIETHAKRLKVIKALLKFEGLDESVIEMHDLFYTTESRKKLWYPGKWSKKALKENGLEKLIRLVWAFNAKPDIGIVSGKSLYLIECKLESLEGFNNQTDVEYRQYDIQKKIADIMQIFFVQYDSVYLSKLSVNEKEGIIWKEALDCIDFNNVDHFTKEVFKKFKNRYIK